MNIRVNILFGRPIARIDVVVVRIDDEILRLVGQVVLVAIPLVGVQVDH